MDYSWEQACSLCSLVNACERVDLLAGHLTVHGRAGGTVQMPVRQGDRDLAFLMAMVLLQGLLVLSLQSQIGQRQDAFGKLITATDPLTLGQGYAGHPIVPDCPTAR